MSPAGGDRHGNRAVALTSFNEGAWIRRFGAVLEEVAAKAMPQYSSDPRGLFGVLPIDVSRRIGREGYRSLAARAKHDATASSEFDKSRLRVRTDPVEAEAILREHPLAESWLIPSGGDKMVQVLHRGYGLDASRLVEPLAKLSVKEGGGEAASRLHRFLKAMESGCVPADEIIVFHGLNVPERVDLGRGAYLASYEQARTEFDLPEEPEVTEKSTPNAAVLVRRMWCAPGVEREDDGTYLRRPEAIYRFPCNYRISLPDWFRDAKLLVALFSIAARAPLHSRTRHFRFRKWIRELEPNLALCHRVPTGYYSSDEFPKGRDLSRTDVDAFVAICRDWYAHAETPHLLELAVRRLAASFSRPRGPFGTEDRILDVAIALEIFYGGKKGHELAKRAARLLGADAGEQIRTYDQARGFYSVRSKIVHAKEPGHRSDALHGQLEAGQDLAARSLSSLLRHRQPVDWAQVRPHLEDEAEAHVERHRPNRGCNRPR